MRWLVLISSIAAVGCQSYKRGVELICDSPKNVESHPDEAYETVLIAEWVGHNVLNDKAAALFAALKHADAEHKIEILKSEAKKVGISDCRLADWIARKTKKPAEKP